MQIPDHNLRITIVGASSPRGKELRDVLEEHGFSSAKFRLFDEDIAVGTLTRSGDEPAIIEAVDEESFVGANLVFFAGRAEMATRHAAQALGAGATVIDLSEDPGLESAVPWIPALDGLVGRPQGTERGLLRSPSAAAIVAASLAAAFDRFRQARMVMVFLRPVSERGQEGIDELEQQTVKLLSFQPVSEGVFGAQVAFNLLDAYGPEGEPSLDAVRRTLARDVGRVLGGKIALPAMQVLQAPIFFSYAFSVYADLDPAVEPEEIDAALVSAGLGAGTAGEPRPTSMSVTGRPQAMLGRAERAAGQAGGFWLWGAADNVRLVAANAVAMAEACA
jgi:aspartate-semialdehyde dehydrogenase